MYLKRWLIIAPLVLILALLQAWYWVPSYESQLRGNPERGRTFVEASIGDAKILNPILNSDTASSRITSLVFDGLLDLDRNLELRGRLAKSWRVGETAYVTVYRSARFPDGTAMTPGELQRRLARALDGGRLAAIAQHVKGLTVVPAQARMLRITVKPELGDEYVTQVLLKLPQRLAIRLDRVDQDLFARLAPVLGEQFAARADRSGWLSATDEAAVAAAAKDLETHAPILEHNPEIEFRLREGVMFHDGHEFDAGDVRFTYQAIMSDKNLSPRSSDFEPVKALEVIDKYRVRIIYKRLFSPAINAWTIGILPEHLLNESVVEREMETRGLSESARASFGLRDSEFNRRPIGTGAFRFMEWQSDELIRLSRNENYWEGAPLYRGFFYRVIPDSLTREVEFRTGAIDTYAPQPHQAARYRDDPRYQAFSSLSFGYTYIGYNLRRAPFDDARVRNALSQAMNVEEIIRYVLYGHGERTTGPYPKNTRWYDHSLEPMPYDPQAALRTFNDLGWRRNADGWLEKDGEVLEFNLITNNGNPVRKAIMTIAQNSWRKIGVKVNTQLFEWAVFLKDFINPGDFDATILGWSMGIDPDLYQLWHSSQRGQNQLNFVGYRNPEADNLIERIRREYEPSKQRRMTHELHRLIAADQPYTFLYASLTTRVLDKKIVKLGADGRPEKITPAQSGDIFHEFNRWRKIELTPQMNPGT